MLEVEDGILRKDAGSVGAYNIVPLTAVVGEFAGWTRTMEWFLKVVEFMIRGKEGKRCSGAMVIDWLCNALQTGYVDVEEAALSLVRVAETAWLKQVSGWVLYGRLPGFGREDFFVQMVGGDIEVCFEATFPWGVLLIFYRNTSQRRGYCPLSSRLQRQLHYFSLAGLSITFESKACQVPQLRSWSSYRLI